MNQEKKKQIATTALIVGGFINFLGCIHILPSIIVTISFTCVLLLAFLLILTGGQKKTNLFAQENATLRSAVLLVYLVVCWSCLLM